MQSIVNVTTKSILRIVQLQTHTLLQISVLFYVIYTCNTSEIENIDKEHLEMFPYCGSMYQERNEPTGRAINADDSKYNYRWSALIRRFNTGPKDTKPKSSRCSGSIITDR